MTVANVGGIAQRLESSYTGSYLVHNSGTAPAYLGVDSSVMIGTQSVTLVPGASLNWSGELWAVATAAAPTTLEIALQGLGHSAPGPSSVALTSPVSLANGTAVGIQGKVSLNNAPVQIYNQVQNLAAGTTQILDTLGTDLSGFSSFYFAVSNTGGVGSPSVQTSQVTVVQWANGAQISSKQYNFLISGSIALYNNIVGDRIVISVTASVLSNVGVYSSLYPVRVKPSAQLAPMPGGGFYASAFSFTSTQQNVPGFIGFDGNVTAAGNLIYLPHTTGANTVFMQIVGSTPSWAFEYYASPANSSGVIIQSLTGPYTTTVPIPVELGCYPIVLSSGTATTGRLIFSCIAEDGIL